MIIQRHFSTRHIKMLVLDEADEMLNGGFKATDTFHLPHRGFWFQRPCRMKLGMTRKFMNNPIHVLVKCDELTLEGIKQFFVDVEREQWKIDTFCDLFDTLRRH